MVIFTIFSGNSCKYFLATLMACHSIYPGADKEPRAVGQARGPDVEAVAPRVVRGQEHDGHQAGQEGNLTHAQAVPDSQGQHARARRIGATAPMPSPRSSPTAART